MNIEELLAHYCKFFQADVFLFPCHKFRVSFFPPRQLDLSIRFRLGLAVSRPCGNGLAGSSTIGKVFPFRLREFRQCVELYPFVQGSTANPAEYATENSTALFDR